MKFLRFISFSCLLGFWASLSLALNGARSKHDLHCEDDDPGLGIRVDGIHKQLTEVRIGHIIGPLGSKPGMIERVMEIGPDLPLQLLLKHKLLVDGRIHNVQDLTPNIRKDGWESP